MLVYTEMDHLSADP